MISEIADGLKRPEVLGLQVGHLPHLEAEDQFNDALRAFPGAHHPGPRPPAD